MNKKGFTLVELLAVIAILAILVIIALPNVMGMFNTAKKNSFITECKNIYSSAQQSWMSDSVFSSKNQKYSKCDTCTTKRLDLSGRDNIDYYIEFDTAGSVVKYYVTDGTYQYKYDGPGLSKTDIKEVQTVTDLDESQILTIAEDHSAPSLVTVYYQDSRQLAIGQRIPEGTVTYNSFQELMNNSNPENKYHSKIVLENDVIKEIYAGYDFYGNPVYLRAGSSSYYESNVAILEEMFAGYYCHDGYHGYNCDGYVCEINIPEELRDAYFIACTNGNVQITNNKYACWADNAVNCELLPQ